MINYADNKKGLVSNALAQVGDLRQSGALENGDAKENNGRIAVG